MHNKDELHGYQTLEVFAPVDIMDIVDIVRGMHEKRMS